MADNNNYKNDNKLHITQWIQIVTAILTMLASFGLWIVRTASTPSIEVQEIRVQIREITNQMVAMQLDNERFKIKIESLERSLEHDENSQHLAR